MTASSQPRPSAASVLSRRDVLWREVTDETVVLDQDGGVILGLNPTGGRVWRLLDGVRSLRDIAGEVANVHAIAPEQAERDVVAFACQIVDRGLADFVQTSGG